jgi:hypothetical protein
MINVQQPAWGVLLPKSAVKFEQYLVGEVLFNDPSQSYDEVYDKLTVGIDHKWRTICFLIQDRFNFMYLCACKLCDYSDLTNLWSLLQIIAAGTEVTNVEKGQKVISYTVASLLDSYCI